MRHRNRSSLSSVSSKVCRPFPHQLQHLRPGGQPIGKGGGAAGGKPHAEGAGNAVNMVGARPLSPRPSAAGCSPASRPARKPATMESPAPTAPFTSPFGAGAVCTRPRLSSSSAPPRQGTQARFPHPAAEGPARPAVPGGHPAAGGPPAPPVPPGWA